MDSLKLVSLNVRGLRGIKRFAIYKWLKDNKFHVCLLQETYCTKDFSDKIKKGWNGEMIHSYSLSKHSKGVSILFSKDLPYKLISKHTDSDGRIILVNIEFNGVQYSICNVYCPNDISNRIAFLRTVKLFVRNHAIFQVSFVDWWRL